MMAAKTKNQLPSTGKSKAGDNKGDEAKFAEESNPTNESNGVYEDALAPPADAGIDNVDEAKGGEDSDSSEDLQTPPADDSKDSSASLEFRTVTISASVAQFDLGHRPRRVDVDRLTSLQKRNLRRLVNGLVDDEVELENGTRVEKPSHAIKWLLEQLD